MGDGPPGFRRNFTCSAVLRIHSGENELSTTGLLPALADLSKSLHLTRSFVTPYRVSYNPKRQASWFGLFPFRSPLLGESIFLSLPPGTEMFQFPGLASLLREITTLRPSGCPIRRSWDHSLFAAPPGLSQLTTSFIASLCQGIHRAPLHA